MDEINPLFTATATAKGGRNGHAACFGGALDDVGGLLNKDETLPRAEFAALVKEAHAKICPCSHATRNNADVRFDAVGG